MIAPSGVYVIDSKRYTGAVELRTAGTIFRPGPSQLFVNGRNQMRRVEAMAAQVAVVANVLGDEGPGGAVVPRPVLCMVDSEWGLFTKPFVVQGVTVTHPRGLQKQLATPGPLTPAAIEAIAQLLHASFRSA